LVSLESVRCKNRIFPKNPVFLYTSDHKIKVEKALHQPIPVFPHLSVSANTRKIFFPEILRDLKSIRVSG